MGAEAQSAKQLCLKSELSALRRGARLDADQGQNCTPNHIPGDRPAARRRRNERAEILLDAGAMVADLT